MPIELTWFIPNRILLMSWSGHITVDDIHILVDELAVVFTQTNALVHAIIDLYGVEAVEPDIANAFIDHAAFNDPRRGQVALVRLPERFMPLVSAANARVKVPFLHVFNTRHQAQDYLLRLRIKPHDQRSAESE